MHQNIASPNSESSAIAAARARSTDFEPPVRFPAEDAARSLAQMAQRDLDAALQLLSDRAQYITGASGAAIALRREGNNDMICRASSGSNAPELGALLSTEFGLSGESVRTRKALRCDDAERDDRVNRDVCRQLGIASVVVMPVVNDDEVLGVFELFSGKANAFGDRDLIAVQRLSEMVETAVRLSHAADDLPQWLNGAAVPVQPVSNQPPVTATQDDDEVLEVAAFEVSAEGPDSAEQPLLEIAADVPEESPVLASRLPGPVVAAPAPEIAPGPEPASPTKRLFWSAALQPATAESPSLEAESSHIPPVLRGLRKCGACGFPVSEGRVLCVECEEKRWRGQRTASPNRSVVSQPAIASSPSETQTAAADLLPPREDSPEAIAGEQGGDDASEAPELILTAGLPSQPSWIETHKSLVGIIVAVILSVVVVLLLR